MVEVGQTAPDFELPDQSGEPVRLSELRGQKVVVYFYPKADTLDHKYSKAALSRSTFSARPRCYLVSASPAAIRARRAMTWFGSAELAKARRSSTRRSAYRRAYVGDTFACEAQVSLLEPS
ncbi:MAG: redoxin domain-containing protein, partial [Solirubrobacteraceae bacterium]